MILILLVQQELLHSAMEINMILLNNRLVHHHLRSIVSETNSNKILKKASDLDKEETK